MIDEILIVLFICMISLNLSWILLFFIPSKKPDAPKEYPKITLILPAHNEEAAIKDSILHCIEADYLGEKEIIVVNDGSKDRTGEIARSVASTNGMVKVIDTDHCGKAGAINAAAEKAAGEILVIIDADSDIGRNALLEMVAPFSNPAVGAVSGIIRAELTLNPLTWFQDIEYMMSSTWRWACSKLNGTYLLPGFTAFRKSALLSIGGFNRETLSEDFEVGLRMKKAGYAMSMSRAVMYTKVPSTIPALVKQRFRWSRGTLQVIKKHRDVPFNLRYGAVGLYGVPTQMYWFGYGVLSMPISLYQIINGYVLYFASYNDYVSMNVLNYLFGWFSLYGMIDYSVKTLTGVYPMTTVFMFCFASFVVGTTYTILAVLKHSKPDIRHLFAVIFFFPYSLFCLGVFLAPLAFEMNSGAKPAGVQNIWTK